MRKIQRQSSTFAYRISNDSRKSVWTQEDHAVAEKLKGRLHQKHEDGELPRLDADSPEHYTQALQEYILMHKNARRLWASESHGVADFFQWCSEEHFKPNRASLQLYTQTNDLSPEDYQNLSSFIDGLGLDGNYLEVLRYAYYYDDSPYWAMAWDGWEDDDDDDDPKPLKRKAAQRFWAMADTTKWHPLIKHEPRKSWIGLLNNQKSGIYHITIPDKISTIGKRIGDLTYTNYSQGDPHYSVEEGGYRPRKNNEAYIDSLIVHPDYRGQGVAQALVERLHKDFPDHKINPGMTTPQGHGFTQRMMEIKPESKDAIEPGWKPYILDDEDTDDYNTSELNRLISARRFWAMPAPPPEGLRFTYDPQFVHPHAPPDHANYIGRVNAYVGDDEVGRLDWLKEGNPLTIVTDRKPGEVNNIFVHPDYRRQSVATEMYDWAKKNAVPELHHSPRRTELGNQWVDYEQSRTARRFWASPAEDAYDRNPSPYHSSEEPKPFRENASGKWYHVSPHKLEAGTILSPGGGESPYGDDHSMPAERNNWVWMDGPQGLRTWYYGTLLGQVKKGVENPWAYIYEVEPSEGPHPWNGTGWEGHAAPSAKIIREIETDKYNRLPDHLGHVNAEVWMQN